MRSRVNVINSKLGSRIFWGILFLLGLSLSINTLTYFNFQRAYGFLRLKQAAVSSGFYLPFYYSHVLISGLVLLSGFAQVSTWFRNRWMNLHRVIGYFYVIGVLFFAAPGALGMSFFVERGNVVFISFVTQSVLWFWFTLKAYQVIKQNDIRAHQVWMWRSFSLALAAISLRVYIFFASFYFDLNQEPAYAIIALLSWIPNLIVVELSVVRASSNF